MTKAEPETLSRDDLALTTAFLISLAATLGALFIGEVLGQMPCTLCWYQRIAMFPLVPILGLSLWRRDGGARAYGLPLALGGLALGTAGLRSDEQRPGHGIGLVIVGDIVAQYGGSIDYAPSAALGGLRVCLRLPL